MNDLWGLGGTAYLDALTLDDGYHIRVESLRDLVAACNREVAMLVDEDCCTNGSQLNPKSKLSAGANVRSNVLPIVWVDLEVDA